MRTAVLALALAGCTTTATPAPRPPAPSGEPVPASFVPVSADFATRQRGWVLGRAADLAGVAATEDGGRTWTYLGAIPAVTAGDPGVTRVRWDGATVWALGSVAAHHQGTHWVQASPAGRDVVSVAAPGEGSLSLLGFAGAQGVREAEVWLALGDGEERLDRVPVAAFDDLETRGGLYYRTAGGSFRASADRGQTWATRTACDDALLDLAGVAPRQVYLLCAGSLRFSADGGRTATVRARRDLTGRRIAANDRGAVVLAGPALEVSNDGGRTFRTVPGAGPWSDPRFVDATFATVVGPGGLYVTTDAGATWRPMRVR
ncbi:MAG TPA: hypothetical protein VF519_14140 [Mycobacteriales bacterium]|jgi:hypothetical protein